MNLNPAIADVEALELPFRGTRTYLHSTHVLGNLAARLSPETPVKLEFRQMATSGIVLAKTPQDGLTRVGTFSCKPGDAWLSWGLYTDPDRPVSTRVECNEKDIVALYDTGGDELAGEIGKPGNFIETIVALNKMIVGRHGKPGGKVLFSAAKLDGFPVSGQAKVKISRFLGQTLFVSDVFWNDKPFGTLTFMVD